MTEERSVILHWPASSKRFPIRATAWGYTMLNLTSRAAAMSIYFESLPRDVAARELRCYRQFYHVYPQIWESATPALRNLLPDSMLSPPGPIRESLTPKCQLPGEGLVTKAVVHEAGGTDYH